MKNSEEPAFPASCKEGDTMVFSGISKREFFAGIALLGLLIKDDPVCTTELLKSSCYDIADEILDHEPE